MHEPNSGFSHDQMLPAETVSYYRPAKCVAASGGVHGPSVDLPVNKKPLHQLLMAPHGFGGAPDNKTRVGDPDWHESTARARACPRFRLSVTASWGVPIAVGVVPTGPNSGGGCRGDAGCARAQGLRQVGPAGGPGPAPGSPVAHRHSVATAATPELSRGGEFR